MPTSAYLEYDKLFRHAAGREHTLAWDELKEDILIWCMTQDYQPFRRQSSILNHLGPLSQVLEVPNQAIGPLTLPRERKSAESSILESALEENRVYSATLAGTQVVLDHIPPRLVPCPASHPTLDLKQAQTHL